jgi:hypothetical protein
MSRSAAGAAVGVAETTQVVFLGTYPLSLTPPHGRPDLALRHSKKLGIFLAPTTLRRAYSSPNYFLHSSAWEGMV